jgi:hypothetical protein
VRDENLSDSEPGSPSAEPSDSEVGEKSPTLNIQ